MGEKRAAEESQSLTEGVKALVVDIEGTTTPITFVHDTLFPHVKKNVQGYLEQTWDNEQCQGDVEALRQQAETDKKAEVEGVVEIPNSDSSKEEVLQATVDNVLWQMSLDKKTTALKQLQGHMWKSAYESEEIKGEVYEDVVPALKRLISGGMKVYVYSSGSVEAQKLLFGFSERGDLSELFSGNFDTKVGAKVESESYKKICAEIDFKPSEVLFLTDVVAESKAAVEAGLRTAVVVRPGNKALSDEDKQNYQLIHSFNELVSDDMPVEKVAKVDNGVPAVDGTGDAAGDKASESNGDVDDDDAEVEVDEAEDGDEDSVADDDSVEKEGGEAETTTDDKTE